MRFGPLASPRPGACCVSQPRRPTTTPGFAGSLARTNKRETDRAPRAQPLGPDIFSQHGASKQQGAAVFFRKAITARGPRPDSHHASSHNVAVLALRRKWGGSVATICEKLRI
jgi:hypothetical protein